VAAAIPARRTAGLAGFFEMSPELMAIADGAGHFVRVNPAFTRTLGYSAAQVKVFAFAELIHPDDLARTEAAFATIKAGGSVAGLENRYRCKDGSYRWLLWSASPVGGDGAFYASGHDLTERRLLEDELRESETLAHEGSRLKSEFVASMSHELRTPLNGVIGLTDLLGDTSLDRVQRDYVDALAASGEALMAVIGAVLDFSKMEAGRLELDRADFELRPAVEEAVRMLADEAHGKGLEIGQWVDGGVPVLVNGDRARLRQILLNLLSNAVKFTPAGEVGLRVSGEPGDRVRFVIEDTGPGIEQSLVGNLFESFTQGDQSTTREHAGSGLGLTIARQLAELMDGEIGFEERAGGGSVFWFTARLPRGVSVPAPRDRPQLRPRRTLIVDDNATNRTILEHQLRGWGLSCVSVDHPSAALTALERATHDAQPFELAVLDFNMPQMNGVELVHEIRKRPGLRGVRLLLLSSAPLDGERLAGVGVSATLMKPARSSAIYSAIVEAFDVELAAARAGSSSPATRRARGLVVLLAEDNPINCTVADAMLNSLGIQTVVASNGREAIEKAAARDYDAILMDCDMPVVDGFEATRAIRATERGSRVPIIALTALSMPGDRERCLAAGMNDYLAKPVHKGELAAAMQRWLPDHAPDAAGSPVALRAVAGAARSALG